MFNKLKNDNLKVDVAELIRNFTGQPYETVDFRNQTLKHLYQDIFPAREEELISLLQEQDKNNQGLVNEL